MKKIHLNAFNQCSAALQSFGQYRNPRERTSTGYTQTHHWVDLAQLLDRGGFDSLFFADVHGAYDVYRGGAEAGIRHAVQFPGNDPTVLFPAMAAATRHLGFISTYSTAYYPPFHTAKLFSSLDHFTGGRVGWNIVTSYLGSATRNGMGGLLAHDQRYERAEEYMEVVYKLWEASWEDGAMVRDGARDMHVDPAKVHPIDHRGTYFDVAGPHMCEPSPQRTPTLLQAGQSGRGIRFGARHGEAIFVTYPTVEAARPRIARIREAAREEGRDPAHIKLLAGLAVVVAETAEEARLKERRLRSYASPEGGFALFGGWTGIDLAKFKDDDVLDGLDSEGIKAAARWFTAAHPGRIATLADAREEMKLASLIPLITGDAVQVAQEIERWADEADIDGINLVPIYQPGSFTDFIDLVVPELRRRGRIRGSDASISSGGETLREHLFGAGHAHLLPDHPGWRIAGVDPRTRRPH
ncbi:MAG: NtaA/DmoA family FMN-dependent monooxygenase [Candidatus Binataceae bacterium]|nr:NtaA/DmoA family FMN-dependent monooxygenase [Candidatus Binataceae bacterium]